MKQEFINLTDKILSFKCNHCGNITKIYPNETSICKVCGKSFDVDISFNVNVTIQSEEYYVYMLKASIINADEAAFNDAMENLASIDSKNDIYLHLRKRKALKNIEDRKNADFIVEYLIIQNSEYDMEEKIKRIKQSPYKDEYLAYFNEEENKDLEENLFKIDPDMHTFEKKVAPINRIGILMGSFSIVSFLILLIFAKILFKNEIRIASLIVLSTIPALFLSISLINFIKIKNKIVSALIFILILVASFIILSFILSFIYGSGNIGSRFNDYFYHLRHCLEEINERINSVYE